ncbi:MAG: UDP-N-acetylmuramate--L-alanine ligase [Candidatus Berkelbacteria bacterium]|nr:UDP-N-acetylmuramate--L-alanine ligase [Candidatus Berkelbacteria bacterium]
MKLYFIGIGGISMSGLAKFLHEQGTEVCGSDLVKNEITDSLREKGIKVLVPQKKENIDASYDEVIYTSAITPGSPGDAELQEAKRLGIKIIKRAAKIGELTKKYKTIAISGTHGKSTTTAMVLQILLEAGKDPSALLGSNFDLIKSNYRVGKSDLLVIESDEFDRSFHNFYVNFGAILNVEADHLDYFKEGLEEIKIAFEKYIQENFKEKAFLVYNADDKNLHEIIAKIHRPDLEKKTFGGKGDYKLFEIKLKLSVPGIHNQKNALVALAIAEKIGIERKMVIKALSKFKGAARRFDFKGKRNGVKVYDDYAHHPTEVKATLQAARDKFKKNRLIAVFQPHQYSRTYFFAKDFATSFLKANIVIIPPIYEVAGRDEEKKIDNFELAKMIKVNQKEVFATKSFEDTVWKLNQISKANDIIIVMGAGPIYQVADEFLAKKT